MGKSPKWGRVPNGEESQMGKSPKFKQITKLENADFELMIG